MNKPPVIIVGAGPVGLATALGLAQQNIDCTIIEANTGLQTTGSRAIVIDRGSLSFFKKVGCLDEMLKLGITPKRRITYCGENELYTNDFPQVDVGEGEIPLLLNLSQTVTEHILLDHANNSPHIQILWGHSLKRIHRNSSNEVVIEVQHDGLPKILSASYVLAADGCRSTTRKLCHLGFPGDTNPSQFLIVDIKVDLPWEKEHHFYFDHVTNQGRTLLVVPQPNNIWRFDWQLPAIHGAQLRAEQSDDRIKERIRGVIGDIDFETIWASSYKFHQRLMETLSIGNIFFLGDAAHLVNPFGGRGMNSGIQDAADIVWRLGAVIHNVANPDFLKSYAFVRGAANKENQRVTAKSMKFIAPTTTFGRLVRNTILHLSKRFTFAQRFVDSGKMSCFNLTEQPIPSHFLKPKPVEEVAYMVAMTT